jgi:UDP-glucose 4,6-dehydratase
MSADGQAANVYTPKVVLLTGGAGFIGSNVCIHLVNTYPDLRLICLDKLDVCSSLNNLSPIKDNPQFTFVHGDICSADLVRHLIQMYDVDTIMHFASQTHVDNSFGNSLHFTESNVKGTHTLLECVKSCGNQIRRFIHVSTDEVYGEQDADSNRSREHETPLNPTNPYAATKAAAEFIVKSYRSSFNLPTIITRGNNVYGPRQYPEKLIPKFTNILRRGGSCPLHGSGKNRRSFLHVEDVARAFDVILHRGVTGEIYNIGSEEEFENIDILKRLVQIFRRKYPQCLNADLPDSHYITFVRDRAFNDFRYHIDSSSLYQLGWQRLETDLDQGLEKTVDWYMNHPKHWPNIESALAAHPYLLPDIKGISAAEATQPSLPVAPLPLAPALVPQASGAIQPPQSPMSPGVTNSSKALKWLVFGHKGWIGGQLLQVFKTSRPQDQIFLASSRADDEAAVEQELLTLRPDRVISLIGRTHGPGFATIDYLEQKGKLAENIRDNLYAPLCIMYLCSKHSIHYTYLGTGCIFTYDADHPLGDDPKNGFTEASLPNFFGSAYSTVKGFTDRIFHLMGGQALNVRIRMPITADDSPRNFITKITTYKKICSISNSMTVLPELLPIMLEMSARKEVGTVNLVNPNPISHNQILTKYREIVDPSFKWEEFSVEEQNKILAAERSNNCLSTTRLQSFAPNVLTSEKAVEKVLQQMAERRKKAGAN